MVCEYICILDVEQFLSGTTEILSPLIKRFSGADIIEKLHSSILAMATRQLVADRNPTIYYYEFMLLFVFMY